MTQDVLTRGLRRPLRARLNVPRAMRTPLAVTGGAIVLVWLFVAIFAPWIAPYDPLAQSFTKLLAPNAVNWFGTDEVGRDVLSRVIAGSRVSILLALLLVASSLVIGTILGAIAGYIGKAADEIIMRIADLVFAFPTIILAMVIAASLGPSLTNAVIAMLIVSWPAYARVTRSLVLGARTSEYVIAGRLLGNSAAVSLSKDILPNIIAPVFVLATLDVGTAILLLSGLSFLGLGAVPPTPDWGAMVSSGVLNFSSWWIAVFPGLAILTVVLAFNFLGDALRDSLDPRTAESVQGRAL
jgi:peptide/nickel transport system permease protein